MNVDDDNCGLGLDKALIENMMRIKNINNGNRTTGRSDSRSWCGNLIIYIRFDNHVFMIQPVMDKINHY